MPKCCVKGCGMRYSSKSSHVSLHKLPETESLRQKWLESLGPENIDRTQKKSFVCSLHFKEHCFNRTLNVVRLQNHAIPTPLSQKLVKAERVATVAMNIQQSTSETKVVKAEPVATVDMNIQQSTSETDSPLVEKLKEKCNEQRKIIKRLNEKCRRQAKKLADLYNIIDDLKKRKFTNNEGSI